MGDLKSGEETVLISKKSILQPKLAGNKVAFLSMEYVDKESFTNLWIYDLKNGSLKSFYTEQTRLEEPFGRVLSWAPDKNCIGIFPRIQLCK